MQGSGGLSVSEIWTLNDSCTSLVESEVSEKLHPLYSPHHKPSSQKSPRVSHRGTGQRGGQASREDAAVLLAHRAHPRAAGPLPSAPSQPPWPPLAPTGASMTLGFPDSFPSSFSSPNLPCKDQPLNGDIRDQMPRAQGNEMCNEIELSSRGGWAPEAPGAVRRIVWSCQLWPPGSQTVPGWSEQG